MREFENSKKQKRGFSLLEVVIGLSLVAITMAGVFQILQIALNSSYRATQEMIAINLARGLMAEIMSKEFEEPGGGGGFGPEGETRHGDPAYDDVDDYIGDGTGFLESPPYYINGTPMDGTGGTPNYSGFSRNVMVRYVESDLISHTGAVSDYKEVNVTVSGPYVRDISIVEFKIKIE